MKSKVIILALLVIFIILVIGCQKDVCGNGILEEGETSVTCCQDAGCLGEQSCQRTGCVEPTCRSCQYLENHVCKDYECCADSQCPSEERCLNNYCQFLECGSCQYAEDHQCKDYACCSDEDCEDNDNAITNVCVNPKTKAAYCSKEQEDECEDDSDCDDSDVSTKDDCRGTPKKCHNRKITDCNNGDDYCPEGCTHDNDDDCLLQVVDCGSDDECFISQAESCSLAKQTQTTPLILFGVEQTNTNYYELRGLEEERCIFYIKIDHIEIKYTDELVQSLLDQNNTLEEIEQREARANARYDLAEGRDGTCSFKTTDLVEMLNRWKEGTFSGGASCSLAADGSWDCTYSGDFEVAQDCQGTYFQS